MSAKSKSTKGRQSRAPVSDASVVSATERRNVVLCSSKEVANSSPLEVSFGAGTTTGTTSKDSALIAYVQRLSPLKRNRKNTLDYSTLVLQTEETNLEALLYSKSKRQLLMDSEKSHTPLKIYKYTRSADGQKVIINDMTKISTPDQTEYAFQFKEIEDTRTKISSVKEIFAPNFKEWDILAVRGKVLHVGETRVVGTKKLKLASARIADTTGKIWLELWEKLIPQVVPERVYLFTSVQVRIWSDEKKLATTVDTTITRIDDEDLSQITLAKEEICTLPKVINVGCIDMVNLVSASLLCCSCSRKILQASASAIIRCDKCGCRMRAGSCKKQLTVRVTVTPSEGGDPVELGIFENILSEVINNVTNLQDDELAESLLALENIEITYDPSEQLITKMLVL